MEAEISRGGRKLGCGRDRAKSGNEAGGAGEGEVRVGMWLNASTRGVAVRCGDRGK